MNKMLTKSRLFKTFNKKTTQTSLTSTFYKIIISIYNVGFSIISTKTCVVVINTQGVTLLQTVIFHSSIKLRVMLHGRDLFSDDYQATSI